MVITSINERPEAPGKKHPFQTHICQHAEVTLLKEQGTQEPALRRPGRLRHPHW